jgi:hypothetical protein
VSISGCHWSYPTRVSIHSTNMKVRRRSPRSGLESSQGLRVELPLSIWFVVTGGRQVALVSISGCHWSYPTRGFIHSTTRQRRDVQVPGQAVNRRSDFESTCPLSIWFVVTDAGPSPIGRAFAVLPTDRDLVDGGNRGFHGLHGPQVPIITSAFLRESKTVGSGPLPDR